MRRDDDERLNATQKAFPVSWEQFHRDARALAWRLSGEQPFSSIVCVTRGGLVPAAIVARELGLRIVETVCVTSYDEEHRQGGVEMLKGIDASIAAEGGAGVLVVDDLVDTGATARLVRDCCRARISPPSMPSRWGVRWSTRSSPKSRRTPGSISPGISASPMPRRSGGAGADRLAVRGLARYGFTMCGRGGMVDATDLKSVGGSPVRVRVPPPAPLASGRYLNVST